MIRLSIDIPQIPYENITAGHELRKQLLKDYDKVVVPATSKNLVQMKMTVIFNSAELVKFIRRIVGCVSHAIINLATFTELRYVSNDNSCLARSGKRASVELWILACDSMLSYAPSQSRIRRPADVFSFGGGNYILKTEIIVCYRNRSS